MRFLLNVFALCYFGLLSPTGSKIGIESIFNRTNHLIGCWVKNPFDYRRGPEDHFSLAPSSKQYGFTFIECNSLEDVKNQFLEWKIRLLGTKGREVPIPHFLKIGEVRVYGENGWLNYVLKYFIDTVEVHEGNFKVLQRRIPYSHVSHTLDCANHVCKKCRGEIEENIILIPCVETVEKKIHLKIKEETNNQLSVDVNIV